MSHSTNPGRLITNAPQKARSARHNVSPYTNAKLSVHLNLVVIGHYCNPKTNQRERYIFKGHTPWWRRKQFVDAILLCRLPRVRSNYRRDYRFFALRRSSYWLEMSGKEVYELSIRSITCFAFNKDCSRKFFLRTFSLPFIRSVHDEETWNWSGVILARRDNVVLKL